MLPVFQVPAQSVAAAPRSMSPTEASEIIKELRERARRDAEGRSRFAEWIRKYGPDGQKIPASVGPESRKKIMDEAQAIMGAGAADDHQNTLWLKKLVASSGWPRRSEVGEQAAEDAWLLAQHADQDPAFQRRCLDLMDRLPMPERYPQGYAYLTDRVLLAEGKKQRYGTQFGWEEKTGQPKPEPIEDEAHVDERRAQVGLCSMAEKQKELEKDEDY